MCWTRHRDSELSGVPASVSFTFWAACQRVQILTNVNVKRGHQASVEFDLISKNKSLHVFLHPLYASSAEKGSYGRSLGCLASRRYVQLLGEARGEDSLTVLCFPSRLWLFLCFAQTKRIRRLSPRSLRHQVCNRSHISLAYVEILGYLILGFERNSENACTCLTDISFSLHLRLS